MIVSLQTMARWSVNITTVMTEPAFVATKFVKTVQLEMVPVVAVQPIP